MDARYFLHLYINLKSLSRTSDISNPNPVYVVQGGEAVLQCGFESKKLSWKL
jgi:hypothetical protein